jgi:phosphate transport system permease protein
MNPPKLTSESIINLVIKFTGYSAIIFVGLIFYFLLSEGLPALREVRFSEFLQTRWYPIEDYFGILPLLAGSLIVTIGAIIIAVPIGLLTAIYIAEIASPRTKEFLKPLFELLGGFPSVVLGFLGLLILSQYIRRAIDLPTGLSAFTGALILAAIAIPPIVSISEDALDTVPRLYRDAALALGATEWQTIWLVTLPAARSGVLTAIMLGIGRAIGETIRVTPPSCRPAWVQFSLRRER